MSFMTMPYDHLKDDQRAEIDHFREKLPEMTDTDLAKACDRFIWLSAYANNNPTSAYHWMCDFTYAECARRDRLDIYKDAHAALVELTR